LEIVDELLVDPIGEGLHCFVELLRDGTDMPADETAQVRTALHRYIHTHTHTHTHTSTHFATSSQRKVANISFCVGRLSSFEDLMVVQMFSA